MHMGGNNMGGRPMHMGGNNMGGPMHMGGP